MMISSDAVFGLLGVLVGAGLTIGKDVWAHFANQKRVARYLAIRVVCILDKYVEKCVEVVLDDGLSYGQRDEQGCLSPQVKTPPPPDFPIDVDWKSIPPSLMYELLALPNEAESANGAIRFSWDIAGPPDFDEYFEERALRYSDLGLKAADIASRLRKRYDIPALDLGDWKPVERLTEEKTKLAKLQTERASNVEKLMGRGTAE